MKKKFTLLLFLSFFILLHSRAQKEENVWVFGVAAGLDFNSGSAVSISTRNSLSSDSSIRTTLNSGSVCDANGQLLFYTDGDRVWNRDHFVMPNGKDLLVPGRTGIGDFLGGLQSGLIVPVPATNNLYYIFSLERNLFGSFLNQYSAGSHLFYSVVDMDLDGGMGDVVAGQKKIPIDSPALFTEKITAVAGNNCDIWLITMTHDLSGTSEFRAYNITSAGINPVPVTSPFGVLSTSPGFGVLAYLEWSLGKFVFAPDRSKMVHVTGHAGLANPMPQWGGIEMYDFDPATGVLSNSFDLAPGAPVTVPGPLLPLSATPVRSPNGVAFSPDGSKLYALSNNDSVYQWNLDLPTRSDIVASKVGVAPLDVAGSDIKTGPDGKIYFGYNIGDAGLVSQSMHRIESPNLAGTACNVVFDAVALQVNTRMILGLPNSVAVVKPRDTISTVLDTLVCTNIQGTPLLELKVTPLGRGVEWDDGSTDTVRVIHNAGTYWVRKYDHCFPQVDTFIVRGGYIPAVNIMVNNNELSVNSSYDSYQWYHDGEPISGATGSNYIVDTNGVYSVKVGVVNGCSDSVYYQVTNVSVGDNESTNAISIYPNPAHDQIIIHSGNPLRNASLRLTNPAGQVIADQSGINGATFRFDIAAYPAGVYIVEIREDGETIRTRLLKQ